LFRALFLWRRKRRFFNRRFPNSRVSMSIGLFSWKICYDQRSIGV
jgi:hypothetical protein